MSVFSSLQATIQGSLKPDHRVPAALPERRFVPLVEVLATVNRFTHYVDELQHPQQRYHHGNPSEATIYAGLIGIGCAIGLRRMMRISRGISEAELEHTVNWHFALDGIQAANDRVVRLMDRLELPNSARRLPDQLCYTPPATGRNSKCASIP